MVDLAALIAESVELERNATPGPWIADEHETHSDMDAFNVHSGDLDICAVWNVVDDTGERDAAFIAHARTALPALCRALTAAQECVEAMKQYRHADFLTLEFVVAMERLDKSLRAFDRISEGEPEQHD